MDATASSKRKRSDEPGADDENDNGDSVIGLDVGGQLFYTHKSTLTAGSAYFAARFGGSFSAGESYEDERGRKVYFVDADADTFRCILTYLRRGTASWPDLADDPKFYRRLVAEAEYFGVEAMLDKLQVEHIAPNASGKGILYWLGTSKHKKEYQNPYKMGKVQVEHANTNMSDFFEYRPSCIGDSAGISSPIENECCMLWCSRNVDSRQFNFVDTLVMPTHYSLRYGTCAGMCNWNFEASVDGTSWDILHEARKDRHLLQPSLDEISQMQNVHNVDELVSIAEENHRHTWKVDASSYYKYFRFAGLTTEQYETLYEGDVERTFGPDGRIFRSPCLHGVGFELYGDVKAVKTTSCS